MGEWVLTKGLKLRLAYLGGKEFFKALIQFLKGKKNVIYSYLF